MRLAFRFVLVLMLPIAAMIGLDGVLRVERESALLVSEVADHHEAMGRALGAGVAQVFPNGGHAAAAALLATAAQQEHLIDLEWVPAPSTTSSLEGLTAKDWATLAARQLAVTGKPSRETRFQTAVPVFVDDTLCGAVVLRERLVREAEYLDATISRVVINVILTILGVTFVALLFGYFLIGRRIDRLVDMAQHIGRGQLATASNGIGGKDEIALLAKEMEIMRRTLDEGQTRLVEEATAKSEALDQLRHADRLRTVGQLASGMAHELGTPMNVISGRAQLLCRDEVSDAQRTKSAEIIVAQVEKMSAVIRQVLDFSRKRSPPRRWVDARHVVDNVVSFLSPMAKERDVTFVVEGETAGVLADPIQLDQALSNLIVNAIQASPENGTVTLTLRTTTKAPSAVAPEASKWIIIRVADEGAGVSVEDRDLIFDPFFTTKKVGEGTGLGLSVAYGLIRDHDGVLECNHDVERGAAFSIWLPIAHAGESA